MVIDWLSASKRTIVTAESCTGGLIAGALTAVPGSSNVVYGGFVTYANEAKQKMIGVPKTLIEEFGAVSEPVARAMALGALDKGSADIAVSVTGIAGPGGGTSQKPVGLVHFGWAMKNMGHFSQLEGTSHHLERRFGDIGRDAVRMATVETALELVLEMLDGV
ncbi:MAG: CinA family protein [Devosiaceae bacterium]|nr:CinA family protein [Devosiaceae bacterium]